MIGFKFIGGAPKQWQPPVAHFPLRPRRTTPPMNLKRSLKPLAAILALGVAGGAWALYREPAIDGIWQTSEANDLDMRPTIVLSRTGGFNFDVTGRGVAERDAAVARWEMKDRAIWIIEEGRRAKLADVAEVTRTSLILSIADLGVQRFTRIGDAE